VAKGAATLVVATLFAAGLSVIADPAEARQRRHVYHEDLSYGLDPVCGNVPTLTPFIYPVADWGPFFHRVRHFGPVCAAVPQFNRQIFPLD
jgi:hypothetical protein